jgi:hypothetical protein
MAENDKSELFGGSVDRSKLEEMKAAAGDDPVRQAQVAEVQAQVDAVAESDKAAEDARQQAAGETDTDQQEQAQESTQDQSAQQSQQEAAPASQPEPQRGEDLSALTKSELVDRANQAGIDSDGKTKAELVQDLEAQRRGDHNLP